MDSKLATKEHEIKEWALKQQEDNYGDFNRLLGAKVQELENKMRMMLATMKPKPADDEGKGGMSELVMTEKIDNLGMALKNELLGLFEDDRKMKNIRFQEVFHLMESNKNLVNEHIGQQFEALKALTRAYVAKEVAERSHGDESVMSQINRRLDGMDTQFKNLLNDEIKIVGEKLGEQHQQMEEEKKHNLEKQEEIKNQMDKNDQLSKEKMNEIEKQI